MNQDDKEYQYQIPAPFIQTTIQIKPKIKQQSILVTTQDVIKKRLKLRNSQNDEKKNNLLGTYQKNVIQDVQFQKNRRSYQVNGYAIDPIISTNSQIINKQTNNFQSKNDQVIKKQISKRGKLFSKMLKLKRQRNDDPWAGYGQNLKSQPITQAQNQRLKKFQARHQNKYVQLKDAQIPQYPYSTTFHRKQSHDYKGRSYIQPPSRYHKGKGICYTPKGAVQIWQSARKPGFAVGKYFPKFGHLALIGSINGQLKLYDIATDRALVRTYLGHSQGVRGLQFNRDGKMFLSCSYDSTMLNWDTQTGKVIHCYRTKFVPLCIRLYPQTQSEFLTGLSNKQIHQYDMRSGKIQLIYDQHLNGVNTLTFADHKNFVSTSDDKKVFLWQYGVNSVIRHIAQPQMHSITYACMHPQGMYFIGQSSDNRCVVYQYKQGTLRSNKKKNFYGMLNSGYTCGVSFSNDGKLVAAGDQRGRLHFYDWKTCKNLRTLEAHDLATVVVQWHPLDSNQVLTCGWQGTTKLWD